MVGQGLETLVQLQLIFLVACLNGKKEVLDAKAKMEVLFVSLDLDIYMYILIMACSGWYYSAICAGKWY